jgi:hypothetical protein
VGIGDAATERVDQFWVSVGREFAVGDDRRRAEHDGAVGLLVREVRGVFPCGRGGRAAGGDGCPVPNRIMAPTDYAFPTEGCREWPPTE